MTYAIKPLMLVALALYAVPAHAAKPSVAESTCNFYRDADFKGAKVSLEPDASGTWTYNLADQQPNLDKKVSSVACAKSCSAVLYDKSGQKGATKVVTGAVGKLGKDWNDKTRSVEINCPMIAAPEGDQSEAVDIKYNCGPNLTVTFRYEGDAKFLTLIGLTKQDEKLESEVSASGEMYATKDKSEGEAVITVSTKGDDAFITMEGPNDPLKEWNCKVKQ
jgi:membrane-bound inhibitor of C-type lysozyme